MLLNFITWNVNPELIHIGPFSIGSYFILLLIILVYALILGYRHFFQRRKNVINSNNKKDKISLDKKNFKLVRNDDIYFAYVAGLFILLRIIGILGEDLNINLSIRWYGLLWAIGIYATLLIVQRLYKHEGLPEAWLDKLFMYTVVGTIIGARLGHCLFYEWDYFSAHPLEILYIWHGGLASHGGAIGILIAMYFFNKNVSRKGYIWIFDRLVIGVAICGFAIRLGNLMNSEIYGSVTTLPWGFIFVRNKEVLPMHPTQIYEMLYCLITFIVTWWLYWKKEAYKKNGLIFGVFLIGIFGSRFLLEFIKNSQEAFEANMILNMGQILSLPFIIWGIWLIFRSNKVLDK
jgi:phosphatidylglycerol---prolipoprotein diacylglyceryl transferase